MKTFKRSIVAISIILIIVVTIYDGIYIGKKNILYNYDDVILIINNNSQDSKDIGNYFKNHRNINNSNIVYINTTDDEDITSADFDSQIRFPIKNYLVSNNLTGKINYIITTKGVPLKITDARRSVDSELTFILPYSSQIDLQKISNPYFGKNESFSKTKFGIYLVTRLTGYTYKDVKNMIDNAAIATNKGIFVLDTDPSRDSNYGYEIANDRIRESVSILEKKGYKGILNNANDSFVTNQNDVLFYVSWGSNDPAAKDHAKPHNTWVPGAIAETFVSSSGRTFAYPPTYGQSLIADLIAEGVTGVKGYVYEPYVDSMAEPQILLDRYTNGHNLAESYYMASPYIGWMDVIVGDPKTVII